MTYSVHVRTLTGMDRRKPDEARKDDVVRVRVTADQRDALFNAAARAGLEMSAWLRMVGLREAGWTPPVTPPAEPPKKRKPAKG